MFLNILEKESIRTLQIMQLLLLSIRILILLFIILMICRPIINTSQKVLKGSSNSIEHIILIDDSFSMKGRNEFVHSTINKIIQQIPKNNQLTLLNANNGIKYSGLRKDLPDINNLYQTTFYSSYLKNSIKKYISDRKPILSSIMLYIITVFQFQYGSF